MYTLENQATIDYEKCVKCDGNEYSTIYNYFDNKTDKYNVTFPFNTRVLIPYLATLIGFEKTILNFHFINFCFCIISIVMIYLLWSKLKIPITLIHIGLFWLVFHWTGIIRLNVFDPITVDLPLYTFHASLVYIIFSKKYNWLSLLTLIAITQKESFTVYIGLLFIYALIHNKFYENYFPLKPIIAALIISIITKIVLTYFYPSSANHPGSIIAVLFYIKQIFIYPLSIIRWVIAIFIAYGVFILLSIQNLKQTIKISPELNILTILTVVSLMLGIVAGGDFTRIIFLGFPFVMTWILILLKNKSILLSLLSLFLSIPIIRLFEIIPEPIYTSNQHEWYPEFAKMEIVLMWGLYMIVCYWIISKTSKLLQ